MLGIWRQVQATPKSGWGDEDYKKAANDQWLLRSKTGRPFEHWHVFHRLEPALTNEDEHTVLLEEVQETTEAGVTGQKKFKQITSLLRVKDEVDKDVLALQVCYT